MTQAGGKLAERIEFADAFDAVEHFFEEGWTDGLPVVPPTEERVKRFLQYVELPPDEIVGEYLPRARQVTAEKLAINAVMAGCKPEYMPVVLTAVKAICTKEFALNHTATLGSAFPLLIINGPQVKKLGFNSGMYVFGPGNRANATVGRTLSLIMSNCFDARVGGIQRGNMGHAGRYGPCIAENEDTPWEPLHVARGFARDDNVVTAFPSGTTPTAVAGSTRMSAEQVADNLARNMATGLTYYVLVLSPPLQEIFLNAGWSRSDLHQYIIDNAWQTAAQLKRNGRWYYFGSPDGEMPKVEPGDEEKRIYMLKDREQYRDILWQHAELDDREPEILIMVAGGDAGTSGAVITSYNVGTKPVSLKVEFD